MQALEIRNLTKTYRNGFTALRGIDLSVAEGDFFALLGPNGAGKTTAIGIITSLVNKTSGSVKIFGHDIDTELEAAKACIGVVPQEINLNQWDTAYNCVYNRPAFTASVRRAPANGRRRCCANCSCMTAAATLPAIFPAA
jgi:ABC-2 type transport system ATP-binding protein